MTLSAVDRRIGGAAPSCPVAGQNVGLPRLVNNLFGGVPLLCHEPGLLGFNILGKINLDQKLQFSS